MTERKVIVVLLQVGACPREKNHKQKSKKTQITVHNNMSVHGVHKESVHSSGIKTDRPTATVGTEAVRVKKKEYSTFKSQQLVKRY